MEKEDLDKIQSFLDKLKKEKQKKVAICLHENPVADPDTMGSAVGMRLFLKKQGIEGIIYYKGEISHPQNKTIVNVLNIEMIKDVVPDGLPIIVVDGTEKNAGVNRADLVIDHHKSESKAEYQIINPNYGACSTMVWEIIKEADIIKKENADTFTSMLLGIRTDTNDLISENMIENDFVAYQELLKLSDKEKLQKVMNYPLPRYLYDARLDLRKDGNYHEADGTFIGGIGYIPSSQRDAIAILAEDYTRMDAVQTAVIFAITDKKYLEVSVRSSNVSLDVGAMCKDLFDGGGNAYKGGGKIPLAFWSNLENGEKTKFWDITCKHMFRTVLKENWAETVEE